MKPYPYATFQKSSWTDQCDLCNSGLRDVALIYYDPIEDVGGKIAYTQYVRICADCASRITDVFSAPTQRDEP